MRSYQVITVFEIYKDEIIVSGGSFDVATEPRVNIFPSSNGGHFQFESSYSGSNCFVNVRCIKDGKETCSSNLTVPINRTKNKFKKTMLGEKYNLFYRSCFEEVASIGADKPTKLQKRFLRAKAEGKILGGKVIYVDNGDDESST